MLTFLLPFFSYDKYPVGSFFIMFSMKLTVASFLYFLWLPPSIC